MGPTSRWDFPQKLQTLLLRRRPPPDVGPRPGPLPWPPLFDPFDKVTSLELAIADPPRLTERPRCQGILSVGWQLIDRRLQAA
jgi:hypothetical protein